MNRRSLAWTTALHDIRKELPTGSAVREERLRAAAGLQRDEVRLAAGRGRSGRRYIVSIQPLSEAVLAEAAGAVALAVSRDREGGAHLVGATSVEQDVGRASLRRWLGEVGALGATELHVHRLVDDAAERRAVVADLIDPAPA